MIGKTLSHFRIVEKLGEGGMGVVYRAEDRKLGRQVALKVLHTEFMADEERRQRFIREARTAASVTHPNIATVHQIDEEDGVIFIAMELVEGQTLSRLIDGRPLKSDQCLGLAIEMAEGLARAHEANIVHRDLKPENVIIQPDGRLKLLDFGLAKLYDDPRGPFTGDTSGLQTISAAVTRDGRILGTVAYMSPEQARGVSVDSRSDVFTFGIVLYEMATGHSPFQGETITDTLTAILRDRQPPVAQFNPQLPAELERIMARCLEKEPEDRYQDANELLADLRKLKKVTDSQPVPLVSDSGIAMRLKRPGRGRPWLLAAAALLLVALGFAVPKAVSWLRGPAPVAMLDNSLAVLPFENLQDQSDPQRLGQILQELVIADLSGLTSLRVLSSQRLFDIQKQLGRGDRPSIDRDVATQVALRAGATTMLTGSLSQLETNWILTCQLIDLDDGSVIKSESIDGADLYAMVDRLTSLVQRDLGVGADEGTLTARRVKDRTSASLEAYQQFLEGVERLNSLEFGAAAAKLERATEIDPSFGRAYYKLAIARWWDRSLQGEDHSERVAAPSEVLRELLESDVKLSAKDRLLAEAFLALVDMRTSEAKILFERLVRAYPDEKEAWYGLGEAMFHGPGGQPARRESLEPFEKAIELDPSFSLAYYHVVDIHIQERNFDEGVRRVRSFIDQDPDNPSWYREWVRAVVAKGDPDEIEQAVTESLERIVDPAEQRSFLQMSAMSCGKEGQLDLADGLLARAMEVDTDTGEAQLLSSLGQVSSWRGDYARAERYFLQVHESDPKNGQALKGLFNIYHQQRRYADAVDKARALVASDPTHQSYYSFWVSAAIRLGDPQEIAAARDAITELIVEDSPAGKSARGLWESSARAYFELGDYASSAAMAEEALTQAKGEEELAPSNWLGWNMLNLGRPEQAASWFDEVLEDSPDQSDALRGRVMASVMLGDGDAAIRHAEKLFELSGGNPRARAWLIEALLRTGEDARAEELESEFLEMALGPMEAKYFHLELAVVYLGAGRLDKAERLIRRAADAQTQRLETRVPRLHGWILMARGEYEEARRVLQAGLAQAPHDAELLQAAAVNRLLLGDASAAAGRARALLSEGPAHARTYSVLAYALAEQGRFREAEPHARKVFAMSPNRAGHTLLAWVLIAGGLNVDEGLELAHEALALPEQFHPVGSMLPFVASPEHCVGLAYLERGEYEAAREMLENAAALRPDRELIREHLRKARTVQESS